MIEINRRLYKDEKTGERLPSFGELRQSVSRDAGGGGPRKFQIAHHPHQSQTHPLQIASVQAAPGHGRIEQVTVCRQAKHDLTSRDWCLEARPGFGPRRRKEMGCVPSADIGRAARAGISASPSSWQCIAFTRYSVASSADSGLQHPIPGVRGELATPWSACTPSFARGIRHPRSLQRRSGPGWHDCGAIIGRARRPARRGDLVRPRGSGGRDRNSRPGRGCPTFQIIPMIPEKTTWIGSRN